MKTKTGDPQFKFEKGGNSVWHNPFMEFIEKEEILQKYLNGFPMIQDEFLELYPEWINTSKKNSVVGMNNFKYKAISVGCTQALDWFHLYAAQNGLILKLFRGEYPYNRDIGLFNYQKQMINEYEELKEGDALILSYPFSGYGNKHEQYEYIMEHCTNLNIPVLIDCAWLGSAKDMHIMLDYDCIYGVAFSLSKSLSCGNWRSGMFLTNDERCSMVLCTEWNHQVHLNTWICYNLIQNFGPDSLQETFNKYQQKVCRDYKLIPTNTVHICLSYDEKWKDYHRDFSKYYRINIRKPLKLYRKQKIE